MKASVPSFLSLNCKMKLLTHNFYSLVGLCFVSNENVKQNKWGQMHDFFLFIYCINAFLSIKERR